MAEPCERHACSWRRCGASHIMRPSHGRMGVWDQSGLSPSSAAAWRYSAVQEIKKFFMGGAGAAFSHADTKNGERIRCNPCRILLQFERGRDRLSRGLTIKLSPCESGVKRASGGGRQKPEARSQRPECRGQTSDVRGRMSDVGSWRPACRAIARRATAESQRPEARRQMSEARGQRSEAGFT
jgi:hypothetical protein